MKIFVRIDKCWLVIYQIEGRKKCTPNQWSFYGLHVTAFETYARNESIAFSLYLYSCRTHTYSIHNQASKQNIANQIDSRKKNFIHYNE
jgi:hypothetical protein